MDLELDAVIPLSITVTNKPIPDGVKSPPSVQAASFAYIYMSTDRERDAAWGHLIVSIANTGTAIAIDSRSVLKMTFPKDLMTLDELRQVRLEPEFETVWSVTVEVDEDLDGMLVLRLVGDRRIVVSKETAVEFHLQGVLSSANVWMMRRIAFSWSAFSDIRDNSQSHQVTREFLPRQSVARIVCDWMVREEYNNERDMVYVTPPTVAEGFPGIENRLVLRVSDTEPVALKGKDVRIYVSFTTTATGNNNTGLCTEDQLGAMTCRCIEPDDFPWTITQETDGKSRVWVLKAPRETAFGPSRFVSFEFGKIVTQTARAMSSPVLIQWRGLTGYNAGYDMKAVTKTKAFPYVRRFSATVGGQPLEQERPVGYKEKVVLAWDAFGADRCALTGVEGLVPGKGTRTFEPTTDSFDFELTPQITQDGSVEFGGKRRITIKVREPSIVKTYAEDAWSQPSVNELSWECTEGDCSLVAPNGRTLPVARSGTLQADPVDGAYEMVCQGTRTLRQRFPARFSPPSCAIEVKRLQGDLMRFKWQSAGAIRAGLLVVDDRPVHMIEQLSGTADLNVKAGWQATVMALGPNDALTIDSRVLEDGVMEVPILHFRQEKKSPDGNFLIRWKIENPGKVSVVLAAGDGNVWSASEAEGQVTKHYASNRFFINIFTAARSPQDRPYWIHVICIGLPRRFLGIDHNNEVLRIVNDPLLTAEQMMELLYKRTE